MYRLGFIHGVAVPASRESNSDCDETAAGVFCYESYHRGTTRCGATVTGNTSHAWDEDRSLLARKHAYQMVLDTPARVTFDTCRSAMGAAAVLVVSRSVEGRTTRIAFDSVAACTDGGDSGSVSWSDIVTVTLGAGSHDVFVGSRSLVGSYTLDIGCSPAPSTINPPTIPPTTSPTPVPSSRSSLNPTPPPTTSPSSRSFSSLPTSPSRTPTPSTLSPSTSGVTTQGDLVCGAVVEGDTTGAADAGHHSSGDHFWRFAVTATTEVEFNTCGSDFDTYLRIFDGTNTQGPQLATDDDGCQGSLNSKLHHVFEPGSYTVLLEGWLGNEGRYELSVVCQPLPPSDAEHCSDEVDSSSAAVCECAGSAWFGSGNFWVFREVQGSIRCSSAAFDRDPAPGVFKECRCLTDLSRLPSPAPTGLPTWSNPTAQPTTIDPTATPTASVPTGVPTVRPTLSSPTMMLVPGHAVTVPSALVNQTDSNSDGSTTDGSGSDLLVPAIACVVGVAVCALVVIATARFQRHTSGKQLPQKAVVSVVGELADSIKWRSEPRAQPHMYTEIDQPPANRWTPPSDDESQSTHFARPYDDVRDRSDVILVSPNYVQPSSPSTKAPTYDAPVSPPSYAVPPVYHQPAADYASVHYAPLSDGADIYDSVDDGYGIVLVTAPPLPGPPRVPKPRNGLGSPEQTNVNQKKNIPTSKFYNAAFTTQSNTTATAPIPLPVWQPSYHDIAASSLQDTDGDEHTYEYDEVLDLERQQQQQQQDDGQHFYEYSEVAGNM